MYRKIKNLENTTAQLRAELDALKESLAEAGGEPPQGNLGSRPAAVAAPVGFPWALVVQILMAILTYLIQRAITKSERDHLAGLKAQLARHAGRTDE